jgi:hypothetical protein
MAEAPKTKICDGCEQEIGINEETCPKCGVVFADLDEDLKRAEAILAKRKAREIPAPVVETPPAAPKKKSFFKALGKAVKK